MRIRSVRSYGRHSVVLLTFALLTLLSGCTTGRNKGSSAEDTPDTLRVAMIIEPASLDPAKLNDLYTSEMLMDCVEPLVRFNEKNEIEPALAEKWDISPDGKTYTFHLRPGVKFHSGEPVKASDVKFSWERALLPKTASITAENYLDGIIGVHDVHTGKRPDLQGVVAMDDATLQVTIDKPRAFFLGMVAYPTNCVVSQKGVEANGGVIDAKNLGQIGTGPFIFESYTPGQQVRFKANSDYWGGAPKIAHLVCPIILNAQTAYDGYRHGDLDILEEQTAQNYVLNQQGGELKDQYHLLSNAAIAYFGMQRRHQPAFADVRVRKAFVLAVDRDQILKVAYQGIGTRADGFTPPELLAGNSQPPPIPYDPAQAKQMMAQAGYADGKGFPALTLTYVQSNPIAAKTAEMVRANLHDNLHIEVNLQEREAGQFFQDEAEGKMAFYLIGWIADYPDAQDFLSTLLASYSGLDRVKYKNADFDKLCAAADIEPDPKKRVAIYAEANAVLMQDVGVLPIAFAKRIFLIRPKVKGFRTSICSRLPDTFVSK